MPPLTALAVRLSVPPEQIGPLLPRVRAAGGTSRYSPALAMRSDGVAVPAALPLPPRATALGAVPATSPAVPAVLLEMMR